MKFNAMKMNILTGVCALLMWMLCTACPDNNQPIPLPDPDETEPTEQAAFARGADISWLTQMEAEGYKFYTPDADRKETECIRLLKVYCGINAVRLRVWVNPKDGWNGIADVVNKAKRAAAQGMRIMIDFHFSDSWADPGKQVPPAKWKDLNLNDMCKAVSAHVDETMQALKKQGITPEWVQIGNETTPGMLLPMGSVENPEQLTRLNNAGYDAVKAVCPSAKVIVHLDSGNDRWRFERMFDLLKAHGGRYDMIGMSLYPYWAQEQGKPGGWVKLVDDCLSNIDYLKNKYGKPVMICEIGMPYNKSAECRQLVTRLMKAPVEGVFYWEPQAPKGYNGGYNMGCFNNGSPTDALAPFLQ